MTRTFILIATAASVALSGIAVSPGDAEAGKRDGGTPYRAWEFDTRNPVRGKEGFGSFPGAYCSYRREPQRQCYFDHGFEQCKIIGWRLIQKCY